MFPYYGIKFLHCYKNHFQSQLDVPDKWYVVGCQFLLWCGDGAKNSEMMRPGQGFLCDGSRRFIAAAGRDRLMDRGSACVKQICKWKEKKRKKKEYAAIQKERKRSPFHAKG